MSMRLLRASPGEPVHNELVDDLQSIFWVLNFVAIVRFALHGNNLRRGLFVDPGPDERASVAASKLLSIYKDSLYASRYRSAALTELIRDLTQCWTDYEYLHIPPASWKRPENARVNRDMLELAAQPKFWLEKFAKALRKYDEEQEALRNAEAPEHLGEDDAEEMPAMRTGTKRKATEDAPADDGPQLARRSKRLRDMRQRK